MFSPPSPVGKETRAKLSEHGLPVLAASCGTRHSALSKILVLFQLDELQKKHHEADLAVTPLKVIRV